MVPACEAGLSPVYSTPPELPRRLHNEYSGQLTARFTVLTDGSVHNLIIDSQEWRRVGKAGDQPIGYEDAVIDAVSRWRYAKRKEACLYETKITIDWRG